MPDCQSNELMIVAEHNNNMKYCKHCRFIFPNLKEVFARVIMVQKTSHYIQV
jgi:hypothetical protein